MRFLHILVLLVAFAVLPVLASASFADRTVTAQPTIPIAGALLLPDGKPASNAWITVYIVDRQTGQLTSTAKLSADSGGLYSANIVLDTSKNEWPIVLAGSNGLMAPLSVNYSGHATVLEPLTSVRVRLVDSSTGNPLHGIKLSPTFLIPAAGKDLIPAPWSASVDNRWSAVTDSHGTAILRYLPQRYSVVLHFDSGDCIEPDVSSGGFTLSASRFTPMRTVKVTRGGTISGVVDFRPTGQAAVGVTVACEEKGNDPDNALSVTTDSLGKYNFDQLKAGSYCIEFEDGPTEEFDWTAAAKQVVLPSGGTARGIDLALAQGALVYGTVTDKSTGKPAGQMMITSSGPDHPPLYNGSGFSMSDSDGKFCLRLAPGMQTITASPPNGSSTNQAAKCTIDLKEGEIRTLDLAVSGG